VAFLKHTACPRCGSSDALANYSDGGQHCFSCGYHPRVDGRVFLNQRNVNEQDEEISRDSNFSERKTIPEWFTEHLPYEGTEWAASYGITVPELLKWGVKGSIKPPNLLFPLFFTGTEQNDRGDETRSRGRLDLRQCGAYQVRTFGSSKASTHPESNVPKYYTKGSVSEILPIYQTRERNETRRIVLVEDCLSAMKIARQSDAMPCLTSTLSLAKLKRLSSLYDTFLVWLDGNMFDKAQRLARLLQLLGADAKAVYTEDDPKCYNDDQISRVLLTGNLNPC